MRPSEDSRKRIKNVYPALLLRTFSPLREMLHARSAQSLSLYGIQRQNYAAHFLHFSVISNRLQIIID